MNLNDYHKIGFAIGILSLILLALIVIATPTILYVLDVWSFQLAVLVQIIFAGAGASVQT